MGFRLGGYCTIWSSEPGPGNFSKVRLSISRKLPDGTYETEFSGFTTFIGQAHAKAGKLHERDRIKLGDVDVTTKYDKEKNITYTNYKVFDFEFADSATSPKPAAVESNPVDGEFDEDSAPF